MGKSQQNLYGTGPEGKQTQGTVISGASQVVLVVKNPAANVGDLRNTGLIPGLGRFPWRRTCEPTPVFLSGESPQVPMQYCSLQHRTLLPSPVTSTAGCSFCFGSISSFFLELSLHWSPVSHWALMGTWNVRSMNQRKLEVVKQEMAIVNFDILGISGLKWTGMGEFNSDDHYTYYCGQESLRRNGVNIIINKRVQNAVLGCNLKNNRMISAHFQG